MAKWKPPCPSDQAARLRLADTIIEAALRGVPEAFTNQELQKIELAATRGVMYANAGDCKRGESQFAQVLPIVTKVLKRRRHKLNG